MLNSQIDEFVESNIVSEANKFKAFTELITISGRTTLKYYFFEFSSQIDSHKDKLVSKIKSTSENDKDISNEILLLNSYTNNTTMALNLLEEWEERVNEIMGNENVDLSIDDVRKCKNYLILIVIKETGEKCIIIYKDCILLELNDYFLTLFTSEWEKKSQVFDIFEILGEFEENNSLVDEWKKKFYKILLDDIIFKYIDLLMKSKLKFSENSINILEDDLDIFKNFFNKFDFEEYKQKSLPIIYIIKMLHTLNSLDQKDVTSYTSSFTLELSEFLQEFSNSWVYLNLLLN
jgi:hypothetical protein